MSVRTRAVSITDARPGATLSTDQRTRRYLWTMGFRVVAFLGAAITPLPWNVVLIAAAALLPGIAVLLGNMRDNRVSPVLAPTEPLPLPALEASEVVAGDVEDDPRTDEVGE